MTKTHYPDPRLVPDHVAKLMTAEDRKKLGVKTAEERAAEQDTKHERDLQHTVESWLTQRGYWRRSPEWIKPDALPPAGWQIHTHKAKRNPILLDILLLSHTGRYLEFELKGPQTPYTSREQAILCDDHGLPCLRSFEAVKGLVEDWEKKA